MFRLFRNKQRDAMIERLYTGVSQQAREPVLFEALGAPDTLECRFDLLLLHVYLVLRRLHRDPGLPAEAAQELCDWFFADMDRTLREMGVGDLSVPKKMKKIGAAYAGRSAAYTAALEQAGDEPFAEALSRIVYGQPTGLAPHALALAGHMRRVVAALDPVPAMDIVEGRLAWPLTLPEPARQPATVDAA